MIEMTIPKLVKDSLIPNLLSLKTLIATYAMSKNAMIEKRNRNSESKFISLLLL